MAQERKDNLQFMYVYVHTHTHTYIYILDYSSSAFQSLHWTRDPPTGELCWIGQLGREMCDLRVEVRKKDEQKKGQEE